MEDKAVEEPVLIQPSEDNFSNGLNVKRESPGTSSQGNARPTGVIIQFIIFNLS